MKPLTSFSREINLKMNSLSKTLIALIGICLLVSVGNLGIHQVQATSVPAGVVYSAPITLTNTQPVATPAPFQQMITVDSSSYSSYEAPNLQNVEFFDSNGTVIPSWLESGNSSTSTNTVYWLELTDGIPANSSVTVYRGFASTTTSLFDNQTTGEAPQLSPVYGEYDNGAQIFPVYANFGGSALPTDWSLQGSASFVPGTGVETVNGGGNEDGAVVDNASMTSTDIAIEASTSYLGSADDQNIGFYSSGTPSGTGGGPSGGGGLTPNCYSVTFDPWYGTTASLQQGKSLTLATSTNSLSASGYSFQLIAVTPASIQWNFASSSSVYYAPPYSQLTTILTYNGGVSNSYGGLFFSSTTGFGTSTQYIYWLRVRALPPNGVMPGVSTNTTLASSANPSAYGQSVTFTATVTGTGATGTVTFQDGGATLGSTTLSNGTATYTTSTLSAGSHAITAIYSGDTNFAGSTSSALTQTVTQASGTTGISCSSANPSAYGQSVTFTATVTGAGATGTVTFQDGGTALGSATLSNGTATYSTSTLSVGSHNITAVYSGDTNFAGSTSSALTQKITQASTVSVGPVSSKYGGKVRLSATLTSGGSPLSGKTITFTINGAVMGSGSTNKSGVATLTGVSLSGISAGTYTGAISASFAGDTNYSASSGSADLTITSGPNQTPRYAFNGAYATYQISYAYSGFNYGGITVNGGSLNGGVSFHVSNVEAAAQTMNVATSYSGYLAELNMLTDNVSASFSDPSPFPAESQSDLQMLNQGQVPPDMAGATVKTGVSVSVPAGSFKTDQITNTNGDTVWVETSSGLIVKQTGAVLDFPSGTMELQSTNIATAKSFPFIIVIAIVVAAIVIAGVASLLVLRRRKLKESAVAVAEPVMETGPGSGPMAQNSGGLSSDPTQRLQRLKGMLDAGVISRRDYDEQKKKILDEYTK